MEHTKKVIFESQNLRKRVISMLKVDFRRMFTMPLFYILLGISVVIPILVLVMTTMMEGTITVNPSTGVEETIQGFTNVWQAIASTSDSGQTMTMDLTTMCNINMMYFLLAVLICIFVANDFRSGYCKNLFTTRSKKIEYVISKTIVCFVSGVCMIVGYFVGAMLGGAIAKLSFETNVNSIQIVMCLLAKVLLVLVFVAIFLVMSIVGKQRLWLSLIFSFGSSMLLFTMIPMITPLDSTIMNVILCLFGGVVFALGVGIISNLLLSKRDLI